MDTLETSTPPSNGSPGEETVSATPAAPAAPTSPAASERPQAPTLRPAFSPLGERLPDERVGRGLPIAGSDGRRLQRRRRPRPGRYRDPCYLLGASERRAKGLWEVPRAQGLEAGAPWPRHCHDRLH